MIEIKTFLSRVAADMSRGVRTLGKAIGEMICDRTHRKHSIKAGAVFIFSLQSRQSPFMMRHKLIKEPARARVFLRAGSFG